MRVIAGSAGGRKLKGPATFATRPMTDRTREAIFNSLNSLGGIAGAKVIDLFAGTGALGIEAISRGAHSCVFVDHGNDAIKVIRDNLRTLDFGQQSTVVTADARSYIKTADRFDIAFVAPPYVFREWEPIFTTLKADLMVCESDFSLDIPENWHPIRIKKYGQTEITMLEPRS